MKESNYMHQAKEAKAIIEIFNGSFIKELKDAGYSVKQIHDDIIISKEKENKAVKITSYWQAETGYFDEKLCRYTRRRFTDIKEKELEVSIKPSVQEDRPILQFIGGPTGFESYYLDTLTKSLEESPKYGNLSICEGTINSWPHCWVKISDLKEVINHLTKEQSDAKTD